MVPEPTELRLIGWLFDRTKSNTLTPKTNSQTDWQRKISHVMNGIIFCVCSTSAISVPPINCLEVMSKRTQEDAGEERVTAKSKPMMNLVSRYSVRDPNVLASTASESLGKTKSESQNVSLSSWNEQQPRTGRPVMGASSLLSMEHWRQVVFSRVEIWWNDGSKNGETRGWTRIHPEDR